MCDLIEKYAKKSALVLEPLTQQSVNKILSAITHAKEESDDQNISNKKETKKNNNETKARS